MPEKIKMELTPAEAQFFESELGNNPALLMEGRLPERASPDRTLRRLAWMCGAVLTLMTITTGVAAYKWTHLHSLAHTQRVELAALETERDALAAQLRPVGVEATLAAVLAQVSPARLDGRGRNHIAVAMGRGDIGLAEYWEGRGVSWNQPIWFAARVDGIWKTILDAEGDYQSGFSPLMIAARRGHFQVIRYMLHPDRRDKIDWGYTKLGGQSLASILSEQIILYPDNKQLRTILANVEEAVALQVEF